VHRRLLGKTKQRAVLFLILTSIVLPYSYFSTVSAQGTEILSISVSSGIVGTEVTVIANITTSNGQYTVKFDGTNITTEVAVGTVVSSTFNIPETYGGNHTITVQDDATGEVGIVTFLVEPSFVINVTTPVSPLQLQESDSVPIILNVTGAAQVETILMNVTVQTPESISYERVFNVTASLIGSNATILSFPNDFSPNANTSLVGSYQVTLNSTVSDSTFTIGLTNSTQYHRGQTVGIKALYAPNENVSLLITGKNTNFAQDLMADSTTGIVTYDGFVVPPNAQVNYSYMVNITSTSNQTIKSPPDIQNFTILGFPVNFTMNNLAGFPVSGVALSVYENSGTVNVTSGTSNIAGLISLNVEVGTYTANATYKNKKVGDYTSITISESTPQETLTCNLTSMGIVAIDTSGDPIPGISLTLLEVEDNTTAVLNNTDITGVSLALSLLPNNTYVLNATRYATQFNETTIADLSTVDWYNISIIVPTYTLQLNVFGASGQPLTDVTAKASELSGGIIEQSEVSNGLLELNTTLGIYEIQIIAYGVTLNQTSVNLNETVVNASIICNLYGLTISVKVVDYVGQPISNSNVTVENGLWYDSGLTAGDGAVTFTNALGGPIQTTVILPGQSLPYTTTTYYFDAAADTTTVSAGRYLDVGGVLVEVSQLMTILLIIASVVVIACIEVYKWRLSKAKRAESDGENP
jgi:hypothetical protein